MVPALVWLCLNAHLEFSFLFRFIFVPYRQRHNAHSSCLMSQRYIVIDRWVNIRASSSAAFRACVCFHEGGRARLGSTVLALNKRTCDRVLKEFKTIRAHETCPSRTTLATLSHGLYSKFCSSLSRLSIDFFLPICRPSYSGRRGGLMVSALAFESNGPGFEAWPGRCVVFLGKTLYSHSASLHTGV